MLNRILGAFGAGPIDLLGDPSYACWAVLAVDCRTWTPFVIPMRLAAPGSAPVVGSEAAEGDRLPPLGRLTPVVPHHGEFAPVLGPLPRTIDGFETLDLIIPMTKAGPGRQTRLVAVELDEQAFEGFDMGSPRPTRSIRSRSPSR